MGVLTDSNVSNHEVEGIHIYGTEPLSSIAVHHTLEERLTDLHIYRTHPGNWKYSTLQVVTLL